MKQLRDYQAAALAAVREAYAAGIHRQLLSAATGAGKTEMFSFLIKDEIEAGRNCLVLAHRDRLVTQAAARIEGIAGQGNVGVVNGAQKNWWTPCVVATVQSAAVEKQLDRAPKFDAVIVDECHRSNSPTYKKVIDRLLKPGGLLLGVTATPNRTDKKGLIPAVYERAVYEIGMQELIDKGFLCKVIGKEIKLPIDFSKIKQQVGTDGIKDFRADEVQKAFEEADWLERITVGWQEVAADRRTIIFVPPGVVDGRGCGMAHSLAEFMRLRGINAAAVDGTTAQKEQDRVIAEFTSGQIQVLVNVNIFTEGLDIPPIDCVLFARPTTSSIIYSQAIGRGTRLFEGKENCLVIDVTGITVALAKEGQSLMTLGRVLPTEEQIEDERKRRIAEAKRLIRKLWLKRITVKVVEDRIQIIGDASERDSRKVAEYACEIIEILTERDENAANEEPAAGERRAPNTNLLSSDKIEIRDIDFTRAGMTFKWKADPVERKATLSHGGREYLICRPDPNGPYTFADMEIGGIEGRAATYQEAQAAIERHIAKNEIRKQQVFQDPNAAWRAKPASEKQIGLLQKMKIPHSPEITSGQAADLITRAFKRRA